MLVLLFRLMDTTPKLKKPALLKASGSMDGKSLQQYESVFLQVADEHRSVNAFELHELLEACLPNGLFLILKIYLLIVILKNLHKIE